MIKGSNRAMVPRSMNELAHVHLLGLERFLVLFPPFLFSALAATRGSQLTLFFFNDAVKQCGFASMPYPRIESPSFWHQDLQKCLIHNL